MRIILFLLLSWYTIGNIQAQIKEPVKFKNELKMTSETEAEIVFTRIDVESSGNRPIIP